MVLLRCALEANHREQRFIFPHMFRSSKPTLMVSLSMAISRVRCSFSANSTSICCCISRLGPRIRSRSSSSSWRTSIACFCNTIDTMSNKANAVYIAPSILQVSKRWLVSYINTKINKASDENIAPST